MLAKRIIPCLDVKDGRVVKGVKFINIKDAGNPIELGKAYYLQGADELVFLDITASHEKRKIMLNIVREVSKQIFIPFTVGGGIRTLNDIRALLKAGADKVTLNTGAVENCKLIRKAAERFGSQSIVVAIDAKKHNNQWYVYTYGGRKKTNLEVVEWAIQAVKLGAGEILLTSMDADGTKLGFDIELTRNVAEALPVPVIASGGGGRLEHFVEVFKKGRADAALAASIFHYKDYTVKDIKNYLQKKGIAVRI